MKFNAICAKASIPCFLLMAAVYMAAADSPSVTVKGYVLDSACAFTKDLSKPISKQCATSCANAGSQLVIQQGSLYPALYRLEHEGAIAAEWGESDNNRRAKYYSLTAQGRKQLAAETAKWNRMAGIIAAFVASSSVAAKARNAPSRSAGGSGNRANQSQ